VQGPFYARLDNMLDVANYVIVATPRLEMNNHCKETVEV
jgi:hypothetical protein